MCWYIKPLKLATHNTQLNTSSELLALGELIEPSDHENFPITCFLLTKGWGAFDFTLKQSQRLKQVQLSLNRVTECDCEDQYFLYTDVGPFGDDTCAGDSGQPMRGEHPVTL